MRRATVLLLLAPLAAADMLTIPASRLTVPDASTGFTIPIDIGPFQLDRTEVTQREYQQLTGVNPSHYRGPSRPVENVSWMEAISFANLRSRRDRLTPCYDLRSGLRTPGCTGYRLPTSAEWAAAYQAPLASPFRPGGYQDPSLLTAREREGTRTVASLPADRRGLHDMAGNVWEWCEDWYSPAPPLDSTRDPQGPPAGIARVIRGGSFLTGGTQWNRALLSSLSPATRSRFTGFRLARSIAPAPGPQPPDAAWLSRFQQRPTKTQALPLTRTNEEIRRLWLEVLGVPSLPAKAPAATVAGDRSDPTWKGQLIDLAVEPAFPTRILMASPVRMPAARLPVIIVPYYDVDTPAGADLGGRRFTAGGPRAFARLAAQRGFLAVAVKWYGEADAESYDEAVFHLARRHPGVTPMGKWVFDLQRVVDYLLTRPDVDPARIGIIGHSLGGKMALYGAAFEPRIKAIVSSEPGIALEFSNYGDFWYLGRAIEKLPRDAGQHELLALTAPRPFLLIGGESADGDKSWPTLLAAQSRYENKDHIGMCNHRSGHSPDEECVKLAMEWLERFLL
jgi:hypothetical protein